MTARSADRVLGAVLAGGRSSRFGSDKAQARIGGRSMLERATAEIAPWCDAVVVVGRPGGVPDLPAPGLGPLGGIAGALDHALGLGFTTVLATACDMPALPDGLAAALLRRAPAYCREAPVLGHWPAALGAHLLAHLEIGPDRSIVRWARAVGALPVAATGPLPNVNTEADLASIACDVMMP